MAHSTPKHPTMNANRYPLSQIGYSKNPGSFSPSRGIFPGDRQCRRCAAFPRRCRPRVGQAQLVASDVGQFGQILRDFRFAPLARGRTAEATICSPELFLIARGAGSTPAPSFARAKKNARPAPTRICVNTGNSESRSINSGRTPAFASETGIKRNIPLNPPSVLASASSASLSTRRISQRTGATSSTKYGSSPGQTRHAASWTSLNGSNATSPAMPRARPDSSDRRE